MVRYQPFPEWNQVVREDGTIIMVNANPNYDADKFRFYSEQAAKYLEKHAAFQSPKLSAIAVGRR
jgi:hypothetical protein